MLLVTIDIFRWVNLETAERLHFTCPTAGSEHAAELVQVLLAGKSQPLDDDRTWSNTGRADTLGLPSEPKQMGG